VLERVQQDICYKKVGYNTYDGGATFQALAIWDTLSFGKSANMATKSTWTCPAAGLWHIATTFGFNMNTNDQPCSFPTIS